MFYIFKNYIKLWIYDMNKKIFFTSIGCVILCNTIASAQDIRPTSAREAQENRDLSTKRNYDVSERKRPDYDAAGKMAGAFKLLPSVDVTTGYNDNIRSTNGGAIDAIFHKFDPTLRIESQFARHELNLFAGGNYTFYQGESDDNLQGLFVGNEARIDITDTLNLTGGLKYINADEQRAVSNSQAIDGNASVDPIRYGQFDANGAINKKFNRFGVTLGGFYRTSDYDDGIDVAGADVDQDDRDLERYGMNGRVSYDISPDYKVFGKTELSENSYDSGGNLRRDSQGHRTAGGVEFAITNQITGEAFAGYMQRDFDNYQNVSEPYLGGKINWYPTPILSIYANADRDVRDTFFNNASAVVINDIGLGAAYEFARNIIIKPNFSYSFGQYQGIAGGEKTLSAGSNIEYLLNRHFSFIGSYNYIDRNVTNSPIDDEGNPILDILAYNQNVFFLTAKAKL
jgi:hypothetical protein